MEQGNRKETSGWPDKLVKIPLAAKRVISQPDYSHSLQVSRGFKRHLQKVL